MRRLGADVHQALSRFSIDAQKRLPIVAANAPGKMHEVGGALYEFFEGTRGLKGTFDPSEVIAL